MALPSLLQSFRVQLTLAYAAGLLALVLGLTALQGQVAAERALRDQADTLSTLARSTAVTLADGLVERLREVELMSSSTQSLEVDWTLRFDLMQRTRSHVSWIGVADPQGKVVSASNGLLLGQSVAARPWFKAALQGPHVGDVHTALLLAKLLPPAPDGEPLRFIDFAAPIRDRDGRTLAVLGVHVNWDWPRQIIRSLRSPLEREQGVRVFIFDRGGQLIYRPMDITTGRPLLDLAALRSAPALQRWDDGQSYLTAAEPVRPRDAVADLGWTVVARQPVAQARAAAERARNTALAAGLAAALPVALLAWVVAGRLTRPLRQMAAAARALRAGQRDAPLPQIGSPREVAELSQALTEMTDSLTARERELAETNLQLEQRVAERTAELTLAGEQLRAANIELERLATSDKLTGLPNRRRLDEALAEAHARHRRSGRPLALALADVDRFKQVNDVHGHALGDAVLQAVAQAMRAHGRAVDLLGRWGGEEFLLLMPDTDAAAAQAVCERLRAAVEQLREPLPVTVSFGLCAAAQRFDTLAAALAAADGALYRAKAEGRNRVVLHEADAAAAAPIDDTDRRR